MKIFGRDESSNVEDRRGMGPGLMLGGGGGLVVLLISMFLGLRPGSPPAERRAPDPAQDSVAHFTKVVFHDTETVWTELFQRMGRTYRKPVLVLYDGLVQSACGTAQAAVGPFYCPRDQKVYIDLAFYRDMEGQLQISGDFPRAYVLAHEVGHHVQRLLGWLDDDDGPTGNQASVRRELQADYLAGVWAHHGQEKFNFLEKGDIGEAINAAFQIGDDRLQKKSRGYVVPDSFTHGTSRQRVAAFEAGFASGDPKGFERALSR